MTVETDETTGLCWECGYPLRGLPTPRCPECGRAFDPADPATMNLGQHVGPWARRFMRPPGWPLYALVGLAVLLSLWAAASPMPSGEIASMLGWVRVRAEEQTWADVLGQCDQVQVRYAYAVLAWVGAAGLWTLRRVARGITVRRIAPGQRAATFAYWRRWLIPHFVLIATIFFCMTPGPVYLGFWASKHSIDAGKPNWKVLSQNRRFAPGRRHEVQWVGVYPVAKYWNFVGKMNAGRAVIEISHLGGFVYSPNGYPTEYGTSYDLRYMGDGWYSYYRADVYR